MVERKWTDELISDTIRNPRHTSPALNRYNGNPATAYFDEFGHHVVVDDVTNEIIQVTDRLNPSWKPDISITDPFKP